MSRLWTVHWVSVEAFARIVNVLTVENDRLARKSGHSMRPVIPLNPETN